MTIKKSNDSLRAYDWLRGFAHLSGGLMVSALTVFWLTHGEIPLRNGGIRWDTAPDLFALNILVLAATTAWFIRRGLLILANRLEA